MTEHCKCEPGFSLTELEDALNEFQDALGPLVGIGHQAGDTIASFDDGATATHAVQLRPGKPLPHPPGAVIDTDAVYVTGQLQTVTAYRVMA